MNEDKREIFMKIQKTRLEKLKKLIEDGTVDKEELKRIEEKFQRTGFLDENLEVSEYYRDEGDCR